MTKLWNKGYTLNESVENFMTGDDPQIDLRLVKYDAKASIAHALMLNKIGILTNVEVNALVDCLNECINLAQTNQFVIKPEDEDVHTALENYLVSKIGTAGKKIHTARSRNDQILVALRLYMKHEVVAIAQRIAQLLKVLIVFAEANCNVPYAGRTHYQKAMPSSIGLWMGAFIESMLDNVELLKSAYLIIDQSPLGSAASYGVNLNIDREFTAQKLAFAKVQNNVLYANNSRGKFESILLNAFTHIMSDFSKLATDVILFSAPEMAYLKLPQEFCPGSSLMPNKNNPDPFELIRAKSAVVSSNLFQILEIIRALPSGYNRDYQITKQPLFESCDIVNQTLDVVTILFSKITVNREACLASFSNDVFATDQVLELVKHGIAFRDAYKQVGTDLSNVKALDPVENILGKTHIGATGNLNFGLSKQRLEDLNNWLSMKVNGEA